MSAALQVLFRYRDSIGRRVRVAIDREADAWVRQEYRRDRWWTMERHPIADLETVLGRPVGDRREVVA